MGSRLCRHQIPPKETQKINPNNPQNYLAQCSHSFAQVYFKLCKTGIVLESRKAGVLGVGYCNYLVEFYW